MIKSKKQTDFENKMLELGEKGCNELIAEQKEVLGKIAERVGK